MLEEFGPNLFVAHGPIVPFVGFPFPTRMAVARLADGSAWVWSPIPLSPELEHEVEGIGPVRYIVSPNKIHHLFLKQWSERWPDAKVYAPPGLAKRKPELRFDAELGDEPDAAWAGEIDQTIFRGSFAVEEVVFHHRASSTALFCDLIQRHDPATATGWKGWLMRINCLVGEHGGTPREWRATFLRRSRTREAREKVLAWKPERLISAHGACAQTGTTQMLQRALAWI